MSENDLGNKGARALAMAEFGTSFEMLDVRENGVAGKSALALASELVKLGRFTMLNLDGNPINAEAAGEIQSVLGAKRVSCVVEEVD